MAKKSATKAEKHHMTKVAALGCIACRKIGYYDTPAEIHHIRAGMGTGQRNSHYKTIPLCPTHHRHGENAIHRSKVNFERDFGAELDLLGEVMELIG
ncbi:MAG: Ref family recombination enhancement nuclease [Vibrio splendidus]